MNIPEQPERVEGYESFFGLNEAPFSLAPDPRFLFGSASHSAALAQIVYALERREPLVVITGEIGTGKTLLCRTMLQRLRRKTLLSVINDPLLERDDLLKQLLEDFGVISKDRSKLTETSRHELIETLQAFLRSLAPIQAHAVIIIDEAQHLRPDVLEEIRLLSNIDDDRGTLLQIILVGQTDLEPLLSRPELRQLQQRVSRRFRLEPLNRDEVEQYIKHRLALARDDKAPSQAPGAPELAQALAEWAGTSESVEFTPDAIQAVSQLSGGLPRVINLLCDRALEAAYASRLRVVEPPLIHAAAAALGIGEHAAPAIVPATVRAAAPSTQAGPDGSFWPSTRSQSLGLAATVPTADEAVAVPFSTLIGPATPPRSTRYLEVGVALALAAVAVWFGLRAMRPPAAKAPVSAAAPASSPTLTFSPRPEPEPVPVQPSEPKAAATSGTPTLPTRTAPQPTPPRPTTPAPPAAAATPSGERFDIVVASFRTNAPASSVADKVAALGLPMRRRVSDGWQQVVSGPFKSRADAEDAQERLRRAGLNGTHITAIGR